MSAISLKSVMALSANFSKFSLGPLMISGGCAWTGLAQIESPQSILPIPMSTYLLKNALDNF